MVHFIIIIFFLLEVGREGEGQTDCSDFPGEATMIIQVLKDLYGVDASSPQWHQN